MACKRTSLLWLGSLTFLISSFTISCTKDKTEDTQLEFKKPINFPDPVYDVVNNKFTQYGFELGRTLFYDGMLSKDGTISCGNCHQQDYAFSHHGHDVSHGIADRLGTRNSPGLQNLAFYKSFMWDGGIFNLDLQPIAPIENHVEMDESLGNVIAKLNGSTKYRSLFKKAYGSEEITSAKTLKALAQFMSLMISANSKYDKYKRNEANGVLTVEESLGLQIFDSKCRSCHSSDLFTDQSFRNNGLPPTLLDDKGRYEITLDVQDKYKFKVPSLRNVAKTPPYMHDGRFLTLEAVLNHYSSGVQNNTTLDPILVNGSTLGIPLTNIEKQKLIAFLKTLTDEEFIKDRRFSEQ